MNKENFYCYVDWSALGTWVAALIALVGIILALKQFRHYRKELRNKMFIEFRQRFKSDSINIKILEYIQKDTTSSSNCPTIYEVYHFAGFYEELHKMMKEKQISLEDLVYYFGNYYLKVIEHDEISSKIKTNSKYWTRAIDLYYIIKNSENSVLENVSQKFNHKKNITKFTKSNNE